MAQQGDTDVVRDYRRYLVDRGYAPGTVAARVASARRWVAAVDWRAADFRDVERWVADHRVTARSQRNVIGYVRSFYRWAQREGLTDRDPSALVDAPRLPRYLPRPAAEAHIADVLAVTGAEVAAMVGLMSSAGLRCIEVARLRWSDVDLIEGTVRVVGKGTRERVVFLNPDPLRLLAALDGVAGPVFPSPITGGHRTPARISQIVNRAFRAAGYPTVAHQLRHRAATNALAAPGVGLGAVRDMLGHSSVSTTEGYAAILPGLAAIASRSVSLPA
jgi:integrase/recombinase XerD